MIRSLLFLFSCMVGIFSCQKPESKAPNILFIFTDDHAIQAISAYGSVINQTPNIDRLADEGMLFRHAMVTNSICAPSRAVILTGKHSHINGILDNRLRFDSTQVTFPKLLQQGGYETAMIGKWHLKSQPTGFDYWKVLPGQGTYYNPDLRTPEGRERVEGYVTNIVTDLSLDWLKNGRDPNKPFLLMSQHKAPHREWSPSPDHLNLYDGENIPEPPTLFDDYATRASGAYNQAMEIDRHMRLPWDNKVDILADTSIGIDRRALNLRNRMTDTQRAAWEAAYGPRNQTFVEAKLEGKDLVRWKYQRYIKDYLRTIASVDDNIGRILDYLEESGLAENTIVVYSSDQGFYLGEHGWFDKRWMYEESLHTPLIIKWPGITQGGSVNMDLVQNLDYAQTFLDMAGMAAPKDMQGASLVPLLQGKSPTDWRHSVYYHYFEFPGPHSVPRHYGIRTDRYKLIHYYQLKEWELFDLQEDPQELNNIYGSPDQVERIERLKIELHALREKYKDNSV